MKAKWERQAARKGYCPGSCLRQGSANHGAVIHWDCKEFRAKMKDQPICQEDPSVVFGKNNRGSEKLDRGGLLGTSRPLFSHTLEYWALGSGRQASLGIPCVFYSRSTAKCTVVTSHFLINKIKDGSAWVAVSFSQITLIQTLKMTFSYGVQKKKNKDKYAARCGGTLLSSECSRSTKQENLKLKLSLGHWASLRRKFKEAFHCGLV